MNIQNKMLWQRTGPCAKADAERRGSGWQIRLFRRADCAIARGLNHFAHISGKLDPNEGNSIPQGSHTNL